MLDFLKKLLASSEFWAAGLGALAAFSLGALATWRDRIHTRRSAGNLALIHLIEMYSILENVQRSLLVEGPREFARLSGALPSEVQLVPIAAGLPEELARIQMTELGFLVDSRDPGIIQRMMAAERFFYAALELVRKHAEAHTEMEQRLAAATKGVPRASLTAEQWLRFAGPELVTRLVHFVRSLRKDLPEATQTLLEVSLQLREALIYQFPNQTFLEFAVTAPTPIATRPQLRPVAAWRRIVRWSFRKLRPRPPPAERGLEREPFPEIPRFRLPSDPP
jgi:hypothetical protein